MSTRHLLRRSTLSAAVLLAMAPSAFAVDFIFSGGDYNPGVTAPEPLLAGDVLQINAGANKFFIGTTLTNQSGLVNWNAGTLYLRDGALIKNQSIWDARSDDAFVYNGGALPTFNNSGTFRKSAGAGATSIGAIAFFNSGIIDAQTGTINFSGGNATFNAGSQFIGAGSTLVSNNAIFNGAFTASNLSLTNGTFTGGAAQVNGNVNFNGGALTGSWEVAAGQSLSGMSGGNKFLVGAALTNNGSVQWQTGAALYMRDGSSFTNNALHDIQASASIVYNGGSLPTYTNSGGATLRVAAGQTFDMGAIGFVNNGGRLTANGTLNFGGGIATFNNGTVFDGGGTNLITSDASFNGAISSGNLVLQNGTFTGGAAVLSGSVGFTGGYLTGGWELANGQVLNGMSGGNKFMSGAAFANKGSVRWQTGQSLYMRDGSSFDNQGTFNMLTGTALVYNGGALSSFTNSGTLSVAAGESGSVGGIAFVNNGGTVDVGAGGTLTFGGGNATFNAGTRFTGAGVNLVTNDARFIGNVSSQNVRLVAGSFYGGDGTPASKAVVSGTVDFGGGTLTGNWELAAGQTLAGTSGGNKFMSGAAFANKGSVRWQTGQSLYMRDGSSFDNQGTFNILTGTALVYNGGALSSFTNSGTLSVAAGESGSVGGIAFVNNGGTVDVGAGGTLTFGGGNATFNAGTRFTGAGVNLVTNDARFIGNVSSQNVRLVAGSFYGGDGTPASKAVVSGTVDFGGGTLTGNWELAAGQTLAGTSGGNKFMSGATLTNKGNLRWQTGDTLYVRDGSSLLNQGTIDLQADAAIAYNGGAAGSFINTGLITKTGGSGTSTIGNNLGFDNQGVVDVSTGTIRLPDAFTNNGTLKGVGAFATNELTNAGHLAPGSSPGSLTLNGKYVQTAAGFFDVELASSTLFDAFLINGTAKLDGTLALSCVLGCALNDGDVFVILDSTGDLTGTFAATTLLNFGTGFEYEVIYDYGADLVKLQVIHAGVVPEPETWAMLIAGLGVVGTLARRRRSNTRH